MDVGKEIIKINFIGLLLAKIIINDDDALLWYISYKCTTEQKRPETRDQHRVSHHHNVYFW